MRSLLFNLGSRVVACFEFFCDWCSIFAVPGAPLIGTTFNVFPVYGYLKRKKHGVFGSLHFQVQVKRVQNQMLYKFNYNHDSPYIVLNGADSITGGASISQSVIIVVFDASI